MDDRFAIDRNFLSHIDFIRSGSELRLDVDLFRPYILLEAYFGGGWEWYVGKTYTKDTALVKVKTRTTRRPEEVLVWPKLVSTQELSELWVIPSSLTGLNDDIISSPARSEENIESPERMPYNLCMESAELLELIAEARAGSLAELEKIQAGTPIHPLVLDQPPPPSVAWGAARTTDWGMSHAYKSVGSYYKIAEIEGLTLFGCEIFEGNLRITVMLHYWFKQILALAGADNQVVSVSDQKALGIRNTREGLRVREVKVSSLKHLSMRLMGAGVKDFDPREPGHIDVFRTQQPGSSGFNRLWLLAAGIRKTGRAYAHTICQEYIALQHMNALSSIWLSYSKWILAISKVHVVSDPVTFIHLGEWNLHFTKMERLPDALVEVSTLEAGNPPREVTLKDFGNEMISHLNEMRLNYDESEMLDGLQRMTKAKPIEVLNLVMHWVYPELFQINQFIFVEDIGQQLLVREGDAKEEEAAAVPVVRFHPFADG
jgi:hypothetical protein